MRFFVWQTMHGRCSLVDAFKHAPFRTGATLGKVPVLDTFIDDTDGPLCPAATRFFRAICGLHNDELRSQDTL